MEACGSGGSAVERRTVNRGSIPSTAVSKLLVISFTPHLPVSFGRYTKSLFGVYARGSKRSHTGGKCVTYSGHTNSRWTLNVLQRTPSSICEKRERWKDRLNGDLKRAGMNIHRWKQLLGRTELTREAKEAMK